MLKRCLYTLIALLLASALLSADEGRKGQAGFQFLRIPMGARQIAMGNSGISTATGATALYWNPAGVATQKGYEAQFSHVSWFGDVSYQQFTGVSGMGGLGTIGIAIQYLSYPDIVETTEEAPDGTGATFAPYDLALVGNFSRQMTEKVAFGLNFKYISETIAQVNASALAFDIGLTYNTGYQNIQLGFAIANYGSKGQFTGSGMQNFILRTNAPPNQSPIPVLYEGDKFDLPSSVQGGISMMPFKTENLSLLVNADHIVNTYSANRTNLGAELGFNELLFVRAGYLTTSDFNGSDTGQLNFGLGLNYEAAENFRVMFDYAYANLGLLNNANYITVGVTF